MAEQRPRTVPDPETLEKEIEHRHRITSFRVSFVYYGDDHSFVRHGSFIQSRLELIHCGGCLNRLHTESDRTWLAAVVLGGGEGFITEKECFPWTPGAEIENAGN